MGAQKMMGASFAVGPDVIVVNLILVFGTHGLELIGQLFNVANRANYNVPNNNITASNLGESVSLLPNINAPSRHAIRYRF